MNESERNVTFSFSQERGKIQGGLHVGPGTTNADLVQMIDIAFKPAGEISIRHRDSLFPVSPNDRPVKLGHYILSPVKDGDLLSVNDEPFLVRPPPIAPFVTANSAVEHFQSLVKDRDQKCVISGETSELADADDSDEEPDLHTAHIFPVAWNNLLSTHVPDYAITYKHPDDSSGVNSPQNGLLMKSEIHPLWNAYFISVNPTTNKVISFSERTDQYDGRMLDPACRQKSSPYYVPDELLKWHFKQCVLSRMRGPVEPTYHQNGFYSTVPYSLSSRDCTGSSPASCFSSRFSSQLSLNITEDELEDHSTPIHVQ